MRANAIPRLNGTSLFWAIPYFLCGIFSHLLDDPANHALYVWLPSGVAVGAYLLTHRRNWPMLLAAFFSAQIVVTGLQRGEPGTALAFAIAASFSNIVAAWITQRLAPKDGGPRLVAALLVGAVCGAASSALLGGGWLWLTQDLHTWGRLRNWVTAYLAGVLILAPVLTTWADIQTRRSGGPRTRDLAVGSAAYAALVISTLLTFDVEMTRNMPYAVSFELTYLPLVFAVLIALIWGPPGGTLAVVTLTIMTLWQGAQGEGPFIDPDDQWHALLATQVYLIVTALLILLVSTLRGERSQRLENAEQWRGKFELALAGSHQLMYRYTPSNGLLEIAGDLDEALGIPTNAIDNLDKLLALTHPEDRARLKLHWAARRAGASDYTPLLFRLTDKAGTWRTLHDRGSALSNADGSVDVVAGMWRLSQIERCDDA